MSSCETTGSINTIEVRNDGRTYIIFITCLFRVSSESRGVHEHPRHDHLHHVSRILSRQPNWTELLRTGGTLPSPHGDGGQGQS